jgi:hypothetical protein
VVIIFEKLKKIFSKMGSAILLYLFLLKNVHGIKEFKDAIH